MKIAICILDGKPHHDQPPKDAVFVGMEQNPNCKPRYGKLYHPWFNKPCYERPSHEDSNHRYSG